MKIKLMPVEKDRKGILYNLYQYYRYDFSPFTEEDLGLDGRFEHTRIR